MINASSRFKQNAKAPVKTVQVRMTQVVSEGATPLVYTSADLIQKMKIEASSTWLYSGAKKATVTLIEITENLFGYAWVLELGIVDPPSGVIDYITLGTFYTTKCDYKYDKGTTELTLFDYMNKAEMSWQQGEHTGYPKTVATLADDIATNLGYEGVVSMTGLPNATQLVQSDLWALISQEKYREVINEIANITGTTALVNSQNYLEFKPFRNAEEMLTYDNLRTYKLGLHYGKINSVVLSRQPQNDDVALQDSTSIDANGLTEAKIINNQIADNNRQAFIQPLFNALNGIEFDGIEMNTEGHGWYEIGDSLLVEEEANGLPSGFRGVEYIESSTTQWVDTGVQFGANDFSIEIGIVPTADATYEQPLVSIWTSEYNYWNWFKTGQNLDVYTSGHHVINGGAATGKYHDLRLSRVGNVWTQSSNSDSGSWTFSPSSVNNTTLKVFNRGDLNGRTNVQLYYLRIEVAGELVRDFAPCYRESDNVAGLYDKVNGVFYTNAGSGSFTVGADVNKTIVVTDLTMTLEGGGFKETIKCITPDLTSTDYTATGGIKKSIYNTEIKTDKQEQQITSIVSRQDTFEDQVTEEFTQVRQDIAGLTVSVQTTGGGNYIKNSVGYSKDGDGNLVNWTKAGNGTFSSETSPESMQAGAISGNQISLFNATLTQRVILAPNIEYTLSYIGKKSVTGTAGIIISNANGSFNLLMPNQTAVYWEKKEITFTPTLGYVDIIITADSNITEFAITDIMLSQGDLSTPWRQADGEILNTQVAVDTEGIRVNSSVYEGDETVMTPLEFAGYSSVSGTKTKVFSLNRDTTEVQKISIQQQMSMPPLKVIPLDNPSGWAFVKEGN